MKITLICSDKKHPILPYLKNWKTFNERNGHKVDIYMRSDQVSSGDILFLISCSEKINKEIREKFEYVLVLHASDLPIGRGWSPHIWEIINGSDEITISLIEAADDIDTGKIWKKLKINIAKHLLWDEINNSIFLGELELMNWAIKNFGKFMPTLQDQKIEPTYWPKRSPKDSKIDVNKTLKQQFDLLRICDPNRYPAFCEIHGKKYKLILERLDDEIV